MYLNKMKCPNYYTLTISVHFIYLEKYNQVYERQHNLYPYSHLLDLYFAHETKIISLNILSKYTSNHVYLWSKFVFVFIFN